MKKTSLDFWGIGSLFTQAFSFQLAALIVTLSLLLAACSPTTQPTNSGNTPDSATDVPHSAPTQTPAPDLPVNWDQSPEAVIIKVTNCCGFTPEIVRLNYLPEAVVWGDGRMMWVQLGDDGRRRVLAGQLSEKEMAALLDGIEKAGFFGWQGLYSDPNGPTDMPSKCISVTTQERGHEVCEYWQGAPEAFHLIFDNLTNGAGADGQPFIPETGYLKAHRQPRPDRPLEAGEFREWHADAFGMSLADATKGVWVEGETLLKAWDTVNAGVFGSILKEGDDYYMLSLQLPGLSLEPIPGE